MYFHIRKGKQYLDLRGNLILSHNDRLVKTRVKSAGPRQVRHGRYAVNLAAAGFRNRFRASLLALGFIWGPSTALTQERIEKDGL